LHTISETHDDVPDDVCKEAEFDIGHSYTELPSPRRKASGGKSPKSKLKTSGKSACLGQIARSGVVKGKQQISAVKAITEVTAKQKEDPKASSSKKSAAVGEVKQKHSEISGPRTSLDREAAATKIQAAERGRAGRVEVAALRSRRHDKEEEDSDELDRVTTSQSLPCSPVPESKSSVRSKNGRPLPLRKSAATKVVSPKAKRLQKQLLSDQKSDFTNGNEPHKPGILKRATAVTKQRPFRQKISNLSPRRLHSSPHAAVQQVHSAPEIVF
jgi:hypothetical protein